MEVTSLPPWLTQLGPQVAALALLAWVVGRFLAHIEAADKREGERQALLLEALDRLRESLESGTFCRAMTRGVS